jgi:imidazolonepropionase
MANERSPRLHLWHAREMLTLDRDLPPDGRATWDPEDLGLVRDGAVVVAEGALLAVGPTQELVRAFPPAPGDQVIEVGDRLLVPGLVDCHTHALFVQDRAQEFSLRLQGRTYQDIARAGGGIASSVRALRGASEPQLQASLTQRLRRMALRGVTTVEVKTGYALETAQELRSLRAIAAVDGTVATFLPYHAVPPELRDTPGGRARYLQEVREVMLPAVLASGLAAFVDAYVDGAGFAPEEVREPLQHARAAGLVARLHVGQFDDVGGAELAAELRAASADHLEHVSDAGLRAMAAAGTVAVLLPGAAFSLGQPQPDARRLRAHGLSVAVATDANPGTSRTENLPLMASLAVRQGGLTTVEAWHALTSIPAKSLHLRDRGRLRPGLRADLAILDLATWEALPYVLGDVHAPLVLRRGAPLPPMVPPELCHPVP